MDVRRAHQISRSFSRVGGIRVEAVGDGLLVCQHGRSCYFVRESCFWPFVFRVAGAAGPRVANIEENLAA